MPTSAHNVITASQHMVRVVVLMQLGFQETFFSPYRFLPWRLLSETCHGLAPWVYFHFYWVCLWSLITCATEAAVLWWGVKVNRFVRN